MRDLLGIVFGVAGAVSFSQFPEFSQQYLQRLAGQVDALGVEAAKFDATAERSGQTRDQALAQFAGTAFMDEHGDDMRTLFVRRDRLAADLDALRSSDPLRRLVMPFRFDDAQLLAATWSDFRPAVPATADGLICAGAGFFVLHSLFQLFAGMLRSLFRRRA